MIKIEDVGTHGIRHAIRGMRNPMNSWSKSDSRSSYVFELGENDAALAMKLNHGGSVHAKYRRMIMVWCDITAPLYWWKEFDTYRAGVEKNSCSTMHKIHSEPFDLEDFSIEHLNQFSLKALNFTIDMLNASRDAFIATKDKEYWWQMIQLLPSSYNQKRTVMMSYEALANMYKWRKDHKLDEWREFCNWVEKLPYSELITGGENNESACCL